MKLQDQTVSMAPKKWKEVYDPLDYDPEAAPVILSDDDEDDSSRSRKKGKKSIDIDTMHAHEFYEGTRMADPPSSTKKKIEKIECPCNDCAKHVKQPVWRYPHVVQEHITKYRVATTDEVSLNAYLATILCYYIT